MIHNDVLHLIETNDSKPFYNTICNNYIIVTFINLFILL